MPNFLSIDIFFQKKIYPKKENLSVKIKINHEATIYEGDIINCEIIGNPIKKYWKINDHEPHTTFIGNNPVIFDPEPTPINAEYVNLSVYAKDEFNISYDTVKVRIKRLFFGDIQFHSSISDGYHKPEILINNAIEDNYLDFVCLTDHAEIINEIDWTPPQPIWMRFRTFFQFLSYTFLNLDEWENIKEITNEYYNPGSFTTLLGFEYSPGPWSPGGFSFGSNGFEDVGHICFYYKDVYQDAAEYSAYNMHTFDDIFKVMNEEWDKGHYNIGFVHHPLMRIGGWGDYTVNWTFLANNISNTNERDNILRGVEIYSKWGTAIGKYSEIPIYWSYDPKNCRNYPEYWVESSLWEWSDPQRKGRKFSMIASSDNHAVDRPGSASLKSRVSKNHPNPSGIIAAYAIHNTRNEIWDAINNCDIYGSQLLKIRANVRFDDKMSIGRWINCTFPLKIQISTFSTFSGFDSSNKNMSPHDYLSDELNYPISDIWIVKKDVNRGKPYCKVVYHVNPCENLSVVEFEDFDVKPYDFYYIVVGQQGQLLFDSNITDLINNNYMAFIGPFFIENVDYS